MALSAKKQLFVGEYLIDLHAGHAAIRAGYSPRGAGQCGHRLLQEPAVADAVDSAMAARSRRTGVTADRVLRELARIAFSDLRDVVTWGPGGIVLRDSVDLDDDSAAPIIEVSETQTGRQRTLKVKQASKLDALKAMMPHVGLKTQAGEEEDETEKARQLLEMIRAMENTVGAGTPNTPVDAA